jgi:TetR/AcrR family transcriptional regulator, transcriptional repressor of aconitase
MPRVSQQYKDKQRAQILEAARRCFVREGFHRTSLQDVFAEADRSAGAVYRYFPSKEEMIVAIATQNLDDVADVLRTALTQSAPKRGLGEVMAELLEAVTVRQADRQLATTALMVWSEALRNPMLARKLNDTIADMSRDMAGLVQELQEAGSMTGAPAQALAQVILSILPGFLLQLAMLGPAGVAGFPDAVRAVWPR